MKISVHIDGHGVYEAMPEAVDRAIAEYLPSSAMLLAAIVEERSGVDSWPRMPVSASLVVLASFYDGNPF